MKRANFLEEHKSATGSFIKDEDPHNSSTNNNRTKVATSKRAEEVLEIDAFEPSEMFGASGYHSRPHESRLLREHIGHSALQRGMSPPANVKELSSDSRSSANIIEQQSPSIEATQKSMNSSHYQLTKYNRSAYKLKQYISDVNKINLRQSEINAKHQQRKLASNAVVRAKKRSTAANAANNSRKSGSKLHVSTEKLRATANSSPHTAGQLMKKSFATLQH